MGRRRRNGRDECPEKPSVGRRSTTDLEDLDTAALRFHRSNPDRDGCAQRQARDDLIAFALPFAGHIARRYVRRGEPIDDLEQVARIGLAKAVDRYDFVDRYLWTYRHTTFPLTANGRPAGLVTLDRVRQVPLELRRDTRASRCRPPRPRCTSRTASTTWHSTAE